MPRLVPWALVGLIGLSAAPTLGVDRSFSVGVTASNTAVARCG